MLHYEVDYWPYPHSLDYADNSCHGKSTPDYHENSKLTDEKSFIKMVPGANPQSESLSNTPVG